MKEITIPVLWAAAEYYLGSLLWIGLSAGVLALVLWVVALRRRGKASGEVRRALQPAMILSLLAGFGFAASIPALTRSNWSYVAGGTDYIAIVGAGIAAVVAALYLLTPIIMLVKAPRA
ncbi:MAG: hypothetical protein Q8M31_21105 [Beijerinckiaceae bacterium]|nr:hypothetical protein [Beijerinckiaceae bacterium]